MGLGDGEGVAVKPGQLGGEAEELLHADREVGSVEQGAAALVGERLHLIEVGVPAGGADDDAAAYGEHGAHVFNCGFWGGEVDDHVDAGQAGRGERGGVLVLCDFEGAYAVAAFTRDLGDETAGFSLAEYENEHDEPRKHPSGAKAPSILRRLRPG